MKPSTNDQIKGVQQETSGSSEMTGTKRALSMSYRYSNKGDNYGNYLVGASGPALVGSASLVAAQPELGIRPEWRAGNGSRNRVGSCPVRSHLEPRVGACVAVPVLNCVHAQAQIVSAAEHPGARVHSFSETSQASTR